MPEQPCVDMARTDEILARYPREEPSLIQVLQDVHRAYNYLPCDALVRVAEAPVETRPGRLCSPRTVTAGGESRLELDWFDLAQGADADHRKPLVGPGLRRLAFISRLALVRLDQDGATVRAIEDHPQLHARTGWEEYGVEDPRIHEIDGTYAVTYSAYDASVKNRVRVSLAVTDDFRTFERLGPMLERDMRNVVIFPEKMGGRYAALFRPNDVNDGDVGGIFTQIRIGYASDFRKHGWVIEKEPVMRTGFGPSSFSDKIGPGAPPMKTDMGWLHIYHGVYRTMDGSVYRLGVALHDLEDPARIIGVADEWILQPEDPWEITGYVHNVVFTCGAIPEDDGTVKIYWGGADTVMCVGTAKIDDLVDKSDDALKGLGCHYSLVTR